MFALLAMLVGLVAPAGVRALDAARERARLRALGHVVQGLPLEAFRGGKVLTVDAAALTRRMPDWPGEWRLQLAEPLVYSGEGFAQGATLVLRDGHDRVIARWRVEAGSGNLRDAGNG